MGDISKLCVLVLDVSKNLIQIAGMKRVGIILCLCRMCIIFGVDALVRRASFHKKRTACEEHNRAWPDSGLPYSSYHFLFFLIAGSSSYIVSSSS